MGMDAGGSKGGPTSDINVTPLVDVCLVLLIIFMVMVPKNVPEISVRVPPESKNRKQPNNTDDNLVIGLSKEGAVTLNRNQIEKNALFDKLESLLRNREKKVVFIDFEDDANYGESIEVLDMAKRAGAVVLGIVKRKGRETPDDLIGL
ncbi:MAG: biopolymer transporter ExbD [Myxococcales bacterium FL481]|nr:MAG: biopolymer transporter ExbD [Myxococcales bacterium FL481]